MARTETVWPRTTNASSRSTSPRRCSRPRRWCSAAQLRSPFRKYSRATMQIDPARSRYYSGPVAEHPDRNVSLGRAAAPRTARPSRRTAEAMTCSATTPPSRPTASAAPPKARRSSSTSGAAQRACGRRTFAPCSIRIEERFDHRARPPRGRALRFPARRNGPRHEIVTWMTYSPVTLRHLPKTTFSTGRGPRTGP